MRQIGAGTVYPCQEHGEVPIPISHLLGPNGQLKIYPEIAGKGYFDIDYRAGRLVLRATRYIGMIPICDDVTILVESRATINNLMRMIERAGIEINGLSDFIRGYQEQFGVFNDPEALYVTTFIKALGLVSEKGILKRYMRRTTDRELRGRLLMSETVNRFRSRGMSPQAVFEVFDLTEGNPENRIIKYTVERLLKRFEIHLTSGSQKVIRQLRSHSRPFAAVDSTGIDDVYVARTVPSLIRALPCSHQFYKSILWLAYLISTNSGVTMQKIGQAEFETIILDAALVFERYIRRILQDAAPIQFGGALVENGNARPIPLFEDNLDTYSTKPDYYFLKGGQPVAVADAKYKPKISAEDRYEILAFCEALAVSRAAFIVPCYAEDEELTRHYGTTKSGRVVKSIGINLAASDMDDEEGKFIDRLASALGLS